MWHRPPALAVAGSILIITCVTLGLPAVASGQGWYLMAPPPGDDGEPDAKRPLADWELMKSFDAARTCEVFQAKLVKRLEEMTKADLDAAARNYLSDLKKGQGQAADPLETEAGQQYLKTSLGERRARASRCISAADARLQKR